MRQTGRTQWMIDQLADAVAEGQPDSIVVGRTMDQCKHALRNRVIAALEKRGLRVRGAGLDLLAEGSRVSFASSEVIQQMQLGRRAGLFYDHWADGIE